jgi:hypothetical protein
MFIIAQGKTAVIAGLVAVRTSIQHGHASTVHDTAHREIAPPASPFPIRAGFAQAIEETVRSKYQLDFIRDL